MKTLCKKCGKEFESEGHKLGEDLTLCHTCQPLNYDDFEDMIKDLIQSHCRPCEDGIGFGRKFSLELMEIYEQVRCKHEN